VVKKATIFSVSHSGKLSFSFNFEQEQNYKDLEICNNQRCNQIENKTSSLNFNDTKFGSYELFYVKTFGYNDEVEKSNTCSVVIGNH
jgi:hypothetical protein